MEFVARRERTDSAGLRVIEAADIVGISAVDTPAYPGSGIEARKRASHSLLRAVIPYGKALACKCHRGSCNRVRFERGTWASTLADPGAEILAVAGSYARALASRSKGTLKIEDGRDGLAVAVELADTEAARDLAAMAAAVPLVVRPFFADPEFEEDEDGGLATYTGAVLRALIVGPTDQSEGWPEAEIGDASGGPLAPKPAQRRRVWL